MRHPISPKELSMTATIILRKKEYTIRSGMTIRDALAKLEIPLEAVLATRDGELVTEEEILAEGDLIKLVSVISGG
jgi:sulfur carrier protein ThiS